MTLAKELSPGPLMVDVAGLTLTAEDRELLSHPLIGGIVLFARNYEHPAQLSELTRQMRAARNGPLLIAVDQEGGRVQRFKEGFTVLPPMRRYGELYDQDSNRACASLKDTACLLAWELKQHGIDFSFAPVADLDRGLCPAIGDRALHDTVSGVVALAGAVIDGFRAAGCASVIKHFPGHGSVDLDTHTDFAIDLRTQRDIGESDMRSFKLLHNVATGVMPAHVIFREVDDSPATLSAVWQRDILRGEIGFTGPILSDDLSMGAITGRMTQANAAARALEAGTDLALICNDREAVCQALDHADIRVGDDDNIRRRLMLRAEQAAVPDKHALARASSAVLALT